MIAARQRNMNSAPADLAHQFQTLLEVAESECNDLLNKMQDSNHFGL